MPDAGCPTCHQWARRQDWQPVPAGSFPFVIRCPTCGAEADVAAIGYRMTVTQSEKPAAQEKPAAEKKPEMTSGQENALESAHSYVEMKGFSKAGLIQQLSSPAGEGFTPAQARYAVSKVY